MCRNEQAAGEKERERQRGREGEALLASTRRDRSLIFRRKVLAHCLKVDGVTPRRKITSGAASINSLLSLPQRPRAQPPLLARGAKETRLQLFLHPPYHCLPLLSSYLVLSYTAYHATTIRFIRIPLQPSPSLFSESPELNLFLRPSVTQF